jgi:hypothetical protein
MSEKKEYQDIINTYLNNNYFAKDYLLSNNFISLFQEDIHDKFKIVKDLYYKLNLNITKEANLEREFLEPIFKLLNYASKYETTRKIYGKEYQIDYLLFDTQTDKEEFTKKEHLDESSVENVLIISESKSLGSRLDTNKIDFINNPHFQLINYLQSLKHNYGFLTNGELWRFYDLSSNRSEKVFCEVNLKAIIEDDNLKAFNYFYHIFKKDNFTHKQIEQIKQMNTDAKNALEEDLKDIIYGKNSIVDLIGAKIYQQNNTATTSEIFKNSVILTFRLLFIAYFEDKFHDILFKGNNHYGKDSLKSIMEELINNKQNPNFSTDSHVSGLLFSLFDVLDKGSIPKKIPLLNGGLFNADKATLLNADLFTDKELYDILNALLIGSNSEDILITKYRDFKTLSVSHIGSIYEALLEFDFKIALEDTIYIKVKNGKNIEQEGYFDVYDAEELRRQYKKYVVEEQKLYKKGDIYLSNTAHNRKSTASYYTPSQFSEFMVKEAIDKQINMGVDLLDLKIIDNACGSGHFLVEALNYVAKLGLEKLGNANHSDNENNQRLNSLLNEEKAKIQKNIEKYRLQIEIDDFAVLKRTLLKKVIFGLDLNEFAVELTRLILWLDTFIFSTPLSFIEHHIKQGNALIGSRLSDFNKILPLNNNLFATDIQIQIDKLIEKLKLLDNISDTTPEEIQNSKKTYDNLAPDIEKLNLILNFTTYYKFYNILGKDFKYTKPNIDNLNDEDVLAQLKASNEYTDINKLANLYKFFNYEVEFATAFSQGNKGFNVIVGNPPWDKVKLDDKDFFSQYRTNYRQLDVLKKEKVRKNILAYAGIKQEYEDKQEFIKNVNEVYKKSFPYNGGVGDSNLFRFFIENNLSLLAKNGSLVYLTPSDIIYSDSSTNLRKYIFDNFSMEFFYQFENKIFFKDVHKSYKFAIFAIHNYPSKYNHIKTKFMLQNYDGLNHVNTLEYSYDLINKLSPQENSLFEFKNMQDVEIVNKMYAKFTAISPNFIDFRSELHMTNDNYLFKTENSQNSNPSQHNPLNIIPLYEGKMIHQFNNNFASPQYYINIEELQQNQKSKELSRMLSAISGQIPNKGKESQLDCVLQATHYSSKEELEEAIDYDYNYYKVAFRSVARNTDERSIICSLLPKNSISGHSINVSHSKTYILENKNIILKPIPIERLLFANAIFNSLIVDYLIRFIVDINVSTTYLKRLPLPQPSDEELRQNNSYKLLYLNALKLTLSYNSTQFKDLADKFNIKVDDIPSDNKQRDILKIQNDIEVAKIYGISYDELQHLSGQEYFKTMHVNQQGYIKLLLNKAKEQLI